MSVDTKAFPWGVVLDSYTVAGYEITQYRDTFKGKTDGDVLWHVDNHSFKEEGQALIYVGLMACGVNINSAGRLAAGLIRGFA